MDAQARFEALYREHGGAVRRYVRRRSEAQSADDVVADVFVVAWRRLGDIPDDPLPAEGADPADTHERPRQRWRARSRLRCLPAAAGTLTVALSAAAAVALALVAIVVLGHAHRTGAPATRAVAPPACTSEVDVVVLPVWARAGVPVHDGANLRIQAQRMNGTTPVGRPVNHTVIGGPGPSIVDVASPGCWRFTLRWSGWTDHVDLQYR